jgi:peptidoglycan/LPS O-acetylase OafA/YrhL
MSSTFPNNATLAAAVGSHRRADIQGLRALAVTLVVLYHMGLPLAGGFTGVDMFFVISGYVIMESLLREYRAHGRIRFGEFFLRRFKRLFPALVVLVAITLVAATVFLPPFANENRTLLTGLGAIFISANVVIDVTTGDYFSPDARLNPLLHTWSLSVEEQFYLLFPLIVIVGLWWGARRGRPLSGLTALIALITVVSFALALLGSRVSLPMGNSLLGFYSPIPRAWEFGVGALLALWGQKTSPPGVMATRASAWTGIAFISAGVFFIDFQTAFPSEWTLLPVIGTVLLIYAGRSPHRVLIIRGLSVRPSVWLGNVSYSLYLWHWPLIVFTIVGWSDSLSHMSAAVALSLLLSWLSYRFVEQPLRTRDTSTPSAIIRYLSIVVALPGIVIATTTILATRYLLPLVEEVAGSPLIESTARDERCLSASRYNDAWADRCTWFADSPGDPIYLIGDSTAEQLGEGVIVAGEQLGRPVKIWNGVLCIPFNGMLVTNPAEYADRSQCSDYQEFIDARLKESPPGTVIVSFSDITQHLDRVSYTLNDGTVASGSQDKGRILEVPLTDYIQQLQSWGHHTVIAYPIPNFRSVGPGYSPRLCALWELLEDTCGPKVDRADMLTLQREARDSVTRAAATTGSATLDLFDRYCTVDTCSPSRDRLLVYLDDTHITKAESLSLAPLFAELLAKR